MATTVATNAVLQRAGARVIFVTTAGFEDVPFIGRLDKAVLYDLNWKKPKPLVRRSDCFGMRERITHEGEILTPLDPATIDGLIEFVRVRMEDAGELAWRRSALFVRTSGS